MDPHRTLSPTSDSGLTRLEDVTRRTLITSAFAAALLIACGDGDDDEAPASPSPTPAPRAMRDAAGRSIDLPAKPARVIALSEPDLDAALALGLKPVATLNGRGQTSAPYYLRDQASGVPIIGNFIQPDVEKALQLQPDLILAGGFPTPDLLPQLGVVAPTVVTFNLGEGWKTHLPRVAEALGREKEATDFMTKYQQRLQEVRTRLGPNLNAEVSVTRWNPPGPGYMLNDSFAALVLADLGLKRPTAQQQPGQGHSPALSLEQLGLIDADWIFLGTLSPTGDAVKALEEARSTPVFQQLRAFRANHVVPIDGSQWTSIGGPLAAMAILDDVEKAMRV